MWGADPLSLSSELLPLPPFGAREGEDSREAT